jgi:hypothetical protein
MAFARDSYTAAGSQTDFTITFPYIAETHVTVYDEGVLQTEGASNDYTIVSGVTVRFNAAVTDGNTVLLIRSTSRSTRLVDYANASTITEADLDNDSLQAFYMVQEAIDSVATALGLGSTDLWDATSIRITNVADPTAVQDAATKNYVDTVLTANGNVPVPSANKDILVATGATAGDFAFATSLDTATQIADDLIDSQHIAAGALDAEHYAINSIDGTKIALASQAAGDVMYYNGTDWIRLAKGTALQHFRMNAGATAPEWAAPGLSMTALTPGDMTNGGADDLTLLTFASGLSGIVAVELEFVAMSHNAANTGWKLLLGDSGGVHSTGYLGDTWSTGSNGNGDSLTDGFGFVQAASTDAATVISGVGRLAHMGGNKWSWFWGGHTGSGANQWNAQGTVTLDTELTQIQITTTPATALLDGGTINGGYLS